MNRFTKIFKYLHTLVFQKTYNLFQVSVADSIAFLQKLNIDDEDYLIRSRYQYLGWVEIHGKWKMFFFNIVFFFINPFSIASFVLAGFFSKSCKQFDSNTAITFIPSQDLLTKSLLEKYRIANGDYGYILKFSDLLFIFRIFKFTTDPPFFIFKIILKMALYSYNMTKNGCGAIITSSEYSFTSSALTAYCEQRKTIHINVMHGEKFYFIRDSFFRFHECYVWDYHYEKLFRKLKCYQNQFIIEWPVKFLRYKQPLPLRKGDKKKFKYYLDGTEVKSEIGLLTNLTMKAGVVPTFRPHPLHTSKEILKDLEVPIEDYASVDILHSVLSTDYVCAKYSTVLYEAFLIGKNIVIDDLTQPEKFVMLKDLDYIMFAKPHTLLSNFING